MKISILLPYKENFSPNYAGAVSLFVNDTLNESKYKKETIIFGNTDYKKKFNHNYKNIILKNNLFQSQNKKYVDEFIKIEKKRKSNLIELHNRPSYLNILRKKLDNRSYFLYFHNDPLSMNGSKTLTERIFLMKICYKIIFNSFWSKKRFTEGLKNEDLINDKLIVIHQSAKKNNLSIKSKKNIITFVGKLNKSKGYDLFGESIIKILDKYKDWSAIVVGDEPRDKLYFHHKNLSILGFQTHENVLKIFKKSSIAVSCARWNEPFGRASLEASANACAVIISNRGGLPETITNGIIINNLTNKNIYNEIEKLILNKKLRFSLQKNSLKNFYLTHKYITKLIDKVRDEKLLIKKNIYMNKSKKTLRILHVTNFNERHNGRLYFNTGRRINNGFIRLGNSVLEFSDRDIQKNYKNYNDFNGSKTLNSKLVKTCNNYKPDVLVLGHADLIHNDTLGYLKNCMPHLKVAQWFLDPLNKDGPDYFRNKKRILDKSEFVDTNFITTSPDVLNFLSKETVNYFIPNPTDPSFEKLNNFDHYCYNDVFFALSHGVHRGILKYSANDNREKFILKLVSSLSNIKFDIYGMNNIQPIWADQFISTISNSKMGLNLSRGKPIKYYSSDRIAQIIGNGLVTLIDEKTYYNDFFNSSEMIFYRNVSDLSEKIIKISSDEKLRKSIARNGKKKYCKYFNSNLVADFIINKTLDINKNKKYLWHNG